MKGFISILNVALNVGGIFASLFGIICVVKIAFIKPWQNLQVSSERISYVETATESEFAGKAPDKNTVTKTPEVMSDPIPVALNSVPETEKPAPTNDEPLGVKELPAFDRINGSSDSADEKQDKGSGDGFLAWLFRSPGEDPPPAPEKVVKKPAKPEPESKPVGLFSNQMDPTGGEFSAAAPPTVEPTTVEPVKPKPVQTTPSATVIEKIQGGTQNKSLSIALIEGYLDKMGYSDIRKDVTTEGAKIHATKGHSIIVELDDLIDQYGRQQVVGMEGIALIVHPDNPVDTLTLSQLASIYSGDSTRWSQIGESSGVIELYTSDGKAGTPNIFKRLVLFPNGKIDTGDGMIARFGTPEEVIRQVAKSRLGIGMIPISQAVKGVKYISIKASDDSRAIPPSRICAETMEYPLAKPVYFFVDHDARDFTKDFFTYCMSDAGQQVVNQVGLIGQGELSDIDVAQHDRYINRIMDDSTVLPAYKNLIRGADRLNSRYNLRFQNGENVLTINSEANLVRLSEWLKQQQNPGTAVLIGFTDAVGKFKVNQELSQQRAEVIAQRLKEAGIQKVKTAGFGEEMPVGNNESEAGRAANRRVEVWIQR